MQKIGKEVSRTCQGFGELIMAHTVSDLKKKRTLVLRGNFGSKQVGRTLKQFSKFSDEKWRKFFFTFYLIKRVNWVPPGMDPGD